MSMSLRLKEGLRVFVFNEYIDLRGGFDKLSMIVREKMQAELADGDLFLFLGNNRKRLKAICYDGTGLLLIAKRMERGRFMRLEELEEREITVDELDWLMRGSTIRRAKFGSIPERPAPQVFSIAIDAAV
jgi:transposase